MEQETLYSGGEDEDEEKDKVLDNSLAPLKKKMRPRPKESSKKSVSFEPGVINKRDKKSKSHRKSQSGKFGALLQDSIGPG